MNDREKVKRYKTNTGDDERQQELSRYMVMEINRRDREALTELLSTKSGRWFLMRLLDATKVNSICFTGNSKTFYNEGRRDVGLSILADIAGLGINGIRRKQQAEMEYIEFQTKARELATEYVDNKEVMNYE